MKMFSDEEIIHKLTKKQLQSALLDLQKEYSYLQDEYDDVDYIRTDLEIENCELTEQLDELEYYLANKENLIDIQLFKEKLELYGLKSEELWNFIDLYLKLYNKEEN